MAINLINESNPWRTGQLNEVCNISVTIIKTDPSIGNDDGAATAVVSGAIGTVTYVWSTGETTQGITGLGEGQVFVTVYDSAFAIGDLATKCIDRAYITLGDVVSPPACSLLVDVLAENESSEGADDGTAIADVTNAVGNLTYAWTHDLSAFTSTLQAITGLADGVYTVLVTDDSFAGCTATDNGTVGTDSVGSCLMTIDSIVSTSASTGIALDGTATITFSGNAGTVEFLWSNGETTNPAVSLPVGLATVVASDTGVANCIAVDSVSVLPPVPMVLTTNRGVNLDLECVYGGQDDPVWTSVSTVDGTIIETGQVVTMPLLTVEIHTITLTVDFPFLITDLHTSKFADGVIDGYIRMPELVGYLGELRFFSSPLAIELLPPRSPATVTDLRIFGGGWVDLDFTGTNFINQILVNDCTDLETLVFGTVTGMVNTLNLQNNDKILVYDISVFEQLSTFIYMQNCLLLNTITTGSSTIAIGRIRTFNIPQLLALDISGYTAANGEIDGANCPLMTTLSLPVTSGTFTKIYYNGCNLDYTDFRVMPNFAQQASTTVRYNDNNTGAADINRMLVEIAALLSVESAGGDHINRHFDFSGTNAAPDATSGGFDGIAAGVTIVSFGVILVTS